MKKITRPMIYLEDILLAGVMVSALWLFSLDFNSHFTLPKLSALGLVTGALLLPFLLRLYRGDINLPPVQIWLPALCLLCWWLVGTTQSIHLETALFGQPGRFNGLYTHILWLILFFVVASLPFDLQRSRRFVYIFYLAMLPVCAYGLWQYFVGSSVFDIKSNANRPISSIGNPVSLATVIAMIVPFVLQDVIKSRNVRWRVLLALFLGSLFFLLLLTTSRGAWLGAAASILALFYMNGFLKLRWHKNYLWIMLALIVLLVMVVLQDSAGDFYKRTFNYSSIEGRLIYFSAALQIIKDHPFFGNGFESFRIMYPRYRPEADSTSGTMFDITPTMVHNDYLQLAVDNGVPAVLFFILLVGLALGFMLRAIRRQPEIRNILTPVIAAITGFLVYALSGWYEVSTSVLFWLLLGFGVSVSISSISQSFLGGPAKKGLLMFSASAALVFVGYFTDANSKILILDNALRQAQIHQRSGKVEEVDRIAGIMADSEYNNFYYKDEIGLLYYRLFSRYRHKENYNKAHKYFVEAIEENPYSAYIATHLILLDIQAIRLKVIKRPTKAVTDQVAILASKDPGNVTIYETLVKYYAVVGDRENTLENLRMMETIAGGKENLAKRAEALKRRAQNRR